MQKHDIHFHVEINTDGSFDQVIIPGLAPEATMF